jgi:hypothetical protein
MLVGKDFLPNKKPQKHPPHLKLFPRQIPDANPRSFSYGKYRETPD